MATLTLKDPRQREEGGIQPYWQEAIEGRYVPLSVAQLAMIWWLYAQGHINARQLRVVFALLEMAERRRWLDKGAHRLYDLAEIRTLIGGGGEGVVSDLALRRDAAHLTRIGILNYEPNRLRFATSPDQLNVEFDLSGFFTFFRALPHPRRTVPVPRRLLRALAGGFTRAVTGTLIAHVLRSLFWHKAAGGYRVDGRTKASWIVEHFGISRRAVLDARGRLVELGWLEKLPAEQWELNRWGGRYAIRTAGPSVEFATDSAPPQAANDSQSAPPCKQISSSNEEIKKPVHSASGASGVSLQEEKGSRKSTLATNSGAPSIFDIRREDLEDAPRTEALYRHACIHGRANASEHGRLEFFAFVERARAHGHDPCRLLAWLLAGKRTGYVTEIDEQRGQARLKRLDYGAQRRSTLKEGSQTPPRVRGPSVDVRHYMAVLKVVKERRLVMSPWGVAREYLGWDRTRWDQAEAEYWRWQEQKAEATGAWAS